MAIDLRNSPDDQSQRMLNALEPGMVMPIHRHMGSSETCVCIRGHFEEYFYDEQGRLTNTVDMVPRGRGAEYRAGAVAQLEVPGVRDGPPRGEGRALSAAGGG